MLTSETVPAREFLAAIRVRPRRLLLDTGSVRADVPLLRGVWGAALHALDRDAYDTVFAPQGSGAVPTYVLRPAPPDPRTAPAIDWLLFGHTGQHDRSLCRAWDFAGGRGLGPEREPFLVREMLELGPDGRLASVPGPWSLDRCVWPFAADVPCQLHFEAPLRLMRQGRLIEQPTLADLVIAAGRRVAAWLPAALQDGWDAVQSELLAAARAQPSGPWCGQRLDLHRYSARQRAEIDLRGVCGVLPLPEGPGPLAPMLAAAHWLHLGKGTVFGLGQFHLIPA